MLYEDVKVKLHTSLTSALDWVVSSGHLNIAPTVKEAARAPLCQDKMVKKK
jgi:hypothetical protein